MVNYNTKFDYNSDIHPWRIYMTIESRYWYWNIFGGTVMYDNRTRLHKKIIIKYNKDLE